MSSPEPAGSPGPDAAGPDTGATTAPVPDPAAGARTAPIRGLVVLVAAVLLLGVVLGAVWSLLAPGQRFVVIDARTLATLPTESEHVFVDAALFVLLGIVGGVLSAVAAWRWRRARGPLVLLVLVGASVLAAALAHVVGLVLAVEPDTRGSAAGTVVTAAPQLRTWLVLVGQPLGAALGYGAAVAATSDELEADPAPAAAQPSPSSTSPGSPAAPTEPGPPAAR